VAVVQRHHAGRSHQRGGQIVGVRWQRLLMVVMTRDVSGGLGAAARRVRRRHEGRRRRRVHGKRTGRQSVTGGLGRRRGLGQQRHGAEDRRTSDRRRLVSPPSTAVADRT